MDNYRSMTFLGVPREGSIPTGSASQPVMCATARGRGRVPQLTAGSRSGAPATAPSCDGCRKSGSNRTCGNDDARRLLMRTDPARFIAVAAVIIWFGAFLYGSELRTYGLGVVVCVLLGAGVGWGWHYFVDSAGAVIAATSAPPPVGQDKSTTPSSNPLAPRQGSILDIPRSPDLSHVQQPIRTNPRKMCTKGRRCQKYQLHR